MPLYLQGRSLCHHYQSHTVGGNGQFLAESDATLPLWQLLITIPLLYGTYDIPAFAIYGSRVSRTR